MINHFITRGQFNTERFMVSLESPEGRPATLYVDPSLSFGNGDPAITAWISIEPRGNPYTEAEYQAACREEEELDERLMVVALAALEAHGNTPDGVIEAVRAGISLIEGSNVERSDVLRAIEVSKLKLASGDGDIPAMDESPAYVPQYELDERTSQYRLF